MPDLPTDPTSDEAIGARLELTREALGLSQREFAKAGEIGETAYSNYKKGARETPIHFAIKLCDHFDLTLDWIYRGDPSGLRYRLANKINESRQERNKAKKK